MRLRVVAARAFFEHVPASSVTLHEPVAKVAFGVARFVLVATVIVSHRTAVGVTSEA